MPRACAKAPTHAPPKSSASSPNDKAPLDTARLRFIWLPEGEDVALLENDTMIAAIPPWGGENGFCGYARDCLGQSSLCWKLEDSTEIDNRIAAADHYWDAWNQGINICIFKGYMWRLVEKDLLEWADYPRRKPLIVGGRVRPARLGRLNRWA